MWQLCLLSALILGSFSSTDSQNTKDTGCGRYGPHACDDNGKIDLNTELALPGELPWMVMMYTEYAFGDAPDYHWDPPIYYCSGALIHPGAVLVPDICLSSFVRVSGLTVRAGVWDSEWKNESHPMQERTVSRAERPDNSIPSLERAHMPSILILSSPFELGEKVGVVCVPRENEKYDESRCLVSGWNLKDSDPNKSKLKRISSPIVPRDRCKSRYEEVYPPDNFFGLELNERSMCVGSNEHPDMCKMGNQLICPLVDDPSRWVVVGLAVYTHGCYSHKSRYVPSQYANVPAVRAWIDEKMRVNGFSPLVYTACEV